VKDIQNLQLGAGNGNDVVFIEASSWLGHLLLIGIPQEKYALVGVNWDS
jgi:hypothetical protein